MIMKQTSTLSIILFFLSAIHCFFTFAHGIDEEAHGLRLELIHKYSPHSKSHGMHDDRRPKTQMELIKELQRHDSIRHHMMSRKKQQNQGQSNNSGSSSSSSSRRNGIETRTSLALPINSAWDYGYGVYLVRVEVGTPAQTFMMIADTGSDLTWLNCKRGCGKRCSRTVNHHRVFQADLSSTFHSVPCSSPLCKMDLLFMFSVNFCPTPLTPCRYDYSYLQQSSALGFFANDTVTALMMNGKTTRLNNVLIGCTQSIHGRRSIAGGDGILGLGLGRYSFTAKAAENFGGKFSYCLVDIQSHKNVTGHITFGGKTDPAFMKGMSYTTMNTGSGDDDAFYGVNVQGISVGGKMLNIPMTAWRGRNCGTIIDSGTSITTLTIPAYEPVMAALRTALSKFRNVPDEADPFEFCFNSAGFTEAMVPKLVFHFADGARFEPQVSGYVMDVAPQRKCIGIQPAMFPGYNVIGNILQQNHVWEFDLVQEKVGFAPSTCT